MLINTILNLTVSWKIIATRRASCLLRNYALLKRRDIIRVADCVVGAKIELGATPMKPMAVEVG